MRKLLILLLVSLLSMSGYCAWDNDLPADSSVWNDAAGFIRDNNDALEVELGIDLAEAHPYFQAAEPTLKPDGSTALDVDDHGRLWIDSDDNIIYVLTAFGGPTWTSTAAANSVTSSDPTFTLTNTDVEDSDGGRQSQFIGKGTQSGSELTTLGLTEFSHDGTSDDEKGKWRVVLNSGSEGNSPSNVPIEYTADGKIKVATSLSVLDEDTLSSDDDKVVATQQSVKAYVDNSIATATEGDTFTLNDSQPTAMLVAHAYLVQTSGFVTAFDSFVTGKFLKGFVGAANPADTASNVIAFASTTGTHNIFISFFVPNGKYFEITSDGTMAGPITWTPLVTGGGNPIDQD